MISAATYPISEIIIRRGELAYELNLAATEKDIDLFIFGHHHDIWSNLFSAARNAINVLNIDVLVIPLQE